jgi:hypothetical protein
MATDNAPAPSTFYAQLRTPHFWLQLASTILAMAVGYGVLKQSTAADIEKVITAAMPLLMNVAYWLGSRWRPPGRIWDNYERVKNGLVPLPDRAPWPMPGYDLKGNPLRGADQSQTVIVQREPPK